MTSDQALAHIIDRLERGGVGYLLVGALSSNLYGVPRATDDADVEVATRLDAGGGEARGHARHTKAAAALP